MTTKETTMSTPRLSYLSLVVVAALAACSTAPAGDSPLEQARASYLVAQGNPQVVNLAAGELSQAASALKKADEAQANRASSAEVDHLAYMTKQRVVIAQETARQKASDAASARATVDREKMRLDARTVEADTAQRNAAQSKLTADAAERSAAQSKLTADSALLASAASQQQSEASQRQAMDAEARSRDLEAKLKELDIKKTERGLVITLGDVLFDTNKADLKAGGLRNVQKLAGVLKEYPTRQVLIEGFTDSTGTSGYNQGLSDRRAVAVRTALQSDGISAERITDRGYGQTFPVASNATAEGRQLNRRVEIIVSQDDKRIPQR
jgi:outer membrane protein OmpA-like peptidoglycan-associated protein